MSEKTNEQSKQQGEAGMAGQEECITIYTDGACRGNPGPGGYGVVLLYKGRRKELSGGFRRTTNNRMEVLAAIEGLRALKRKCKVLLYSDSKYLVHAMTKGWIRKWQANGWRTVTKDPVQNVDLWKQLLELVRRHEVSFEWVQGHAGTAENETCDQLAVAAAQKPDLPADELYELPAKQAGESFL